MNGQHVETRLGARVVHPLEVVQVIQAPFAAGRRQGGRQRAGQDLHVWVRRLRRGIGLAEHRRVGRRVDGAVTPLLAQVRLVPDDDLTHPPAEMPGKFGDETGEISVVLLGEQQR